MTKCQDGASKIAHLTAAVGFRLWLHRSMPGVTTWVSSPTMKLRLCMMATAQSYSLRPYPKASTSGARLYLAPTPHHHSWTHNGICIRCCLAGNCSCAFDCKLAMPTARMTHKTADKAAVTDLALSDATVCMHGRGGAGTRGKMMASKCDGCCRQIQGTDTGNSQ